MIKTIIFQALFKHCSTKFDGEKKEYDAVTRPFGNLDIGIAIAKTLHHNILRYAQLFSNSLSFCCNYSFLENVA